MSYSHIMCADNEINTGICEYMNTVYVIPKMQPIHKTCSFIFTKLYYKKKVFIYQKIKRTSNLNRYDTWSPFPNPSPVWFSSRTQHKQPR